MQIGLFPRQGTVWPCVHFCGWRNEVCFQKKGVWRVGCVCSCSWGSQPHSCFGARESSSGSNRWTSAVLSQLLSPKLLLSVHLFSKEGAAASCCLLFCFHAASLRDGGFYKFGEGHFAGWTVPRGWVFMPLACFLRSGSVTSTPGFPRPVFSFLLGGPPSSVGSQYSAGPDSTGSSALFSQCSQHTRRSGHQGRVGGPGSLPGPGRLAV